jgi:hypothetical protein
MFRISLVTALVIVGVASDAPRASACSCVGAPTVEASVQASEVAFVATIDSATEAFVYTMTVDQVVKPRPRPGGHLYTAADRQVIVQGGDASAGCGPDYGAVGDRAAVFGRRDDDGVTIVGHGCNPYTAHDLERLEPAPAYPGGRAVAIATIPHGWGNVVALDADGKVVASNFAGLTHLAACPHGQVAGAQDGSLAYLNAGGLRVSPLRIALDFTGAVDRMWCRTNDAGERVIVVVGSGNDNGDAGIIVQRDDNAAHPQPNASDAIVDLDGRTWLMPARRGEPMRALSGVSMGQIGSFDLGDDVVVAAAFDERDRIAMLVSPDERVTVDSRATAIQIVRLAGAGPVLAERIELPVDGPEPRSILMTDQVFVVGETADRIETIQLELDGTIVAAHAGGITSAARIADETWVGTEHGIVRIGTDGLTETIVAADTDAWIPPTVVGLPGAVRIRGVSPPAYELVDFDDALIDPRGGDDDDVASTWDGQGPFLVFAGLLGAALAGALVAFGRRLFSNRRR